MRIFIFRHGEAAMTAPDSERMLTPRGKAQVELMGQFLAENAEFKPTRLFSSPYRRAIETADAIVDAANLSISERKIMYQLEPDVDPQPLIDDFEKIGGDLLIVGHNPNLSIVASLLMSGERSRARVMLDVAEMIALEWRPIPHFGQTGSAELRWMLGPRLLL